MKEWGIIIAVMIICVAIIMFLSNYIDFDGCWCPDNKACELQGSIGEILRWSCVDR